MTIERVAIIGFGEVGRALATEMPVPVRTYDIDTFKGAKYANPADAVANADLVICAVTAAQTIAAAESVAPHIRPKAWYLDLNSASPDAKIGAAHIIDGAGGRYVEAAVMSPIEPKRLSSPMLLGGPHAEAIVPFLQARGFSGAVFYSPAPGKAAATKLCRSVMIKGLEALISESLLSARHYGVEDTVLDSLNNLFPHADWHGYARYMISRTLEHGARRAEEMREAAKTVTEAGVTPWMSEAIIERQAWAPAFAAALKHNDLKDLLDAMRAQMSKEEAAK